MRSSRIGKVHSLASSRRWTDRIVTLAVTLGATLVLMAIASIFLFLIWASWPLFVSDTSPELDTQKVETPYTLEGALSQTEYLLRDTDTSRYQILLLGDPNRQIHKELPGDVVRVAISEQNSPVLATVSRAGFLNLYSDYSRLLVDSSDSELEQPVVSVLLSALPEDLRVQVNDDNVIHVLLRYANHIEWLTAEPLSGPISTPTPASLQRRVSLQSDLNLSRVQLISQGGLLLLVEEDGQYSIHNGDTVIFSGRFLEISEVALIKVLRSTYGLAVLDNTENVRIYGLSFGEQGPAFDFLEEYRLTEPGVTEVLAPPFGGLIAANASGSIEWFDTNFRAQRHFVLPKPRGSSSSGVDWHMTPEGIIVRTAGNEWLTVKLSVQDRSLTLLSLFEPRRYQGYQSAEYIWQSMPLAPTAESKFSITPLILGTIKAAFYSLLFAAPLAIAAAIFTSYFLTVELRARIKPLVELLAAIPTVILGLIAGLWIAPWLEHNLGMIAAFLLAVPWCLYLASKAWRLLPGNRTEARLSGFELLVSAAALALAALVAAAISEWVGSATSHSLVSFLTQQLGLEYEQRNAVVVGVVMGFAVIPTMYSIAEDALAAVPSYLREGALAMGASEWQAAKSVVLPTAAPGIVSAVMMGFARAVGETMIVLMATGNTATMDASLFTGLRTMSATLALEMPEVVAGSLHFHVLMFIALLLFLFTFLLNSVAEWIRAKLRERVAQL